MDQDVLHADAALAGLVIGAEHQPLDDVVDVRARIGVDDAGGVAAQLQGDLLAPGLRLQVPADHPAGEAEQGDALVLHQQRGVVVAAGHDRERARGQVRLGQQAAGLLQGPIAIRVGDASTGISDLGENPVVIGHR